MYPALVCKSSFKIHPSNKRSVTIAFLVDKTISIVVLFDFKLSKKCIVLDLEKWCTLLCETNYSKIVENIQLRSKPVFLCNNFSYSVNCKRSNITLHVNNESITLSYSDLHRMKQLQYCIDSVIIEKQKKLNMYQQCFDYAYNIMKQDIQNLPQACQRNDFTNQYIQDYSFDFSNSAFDDLSFILEVQQYCYDTLSDMILSDIIK